MQVKYAAGIVKNRVTADRRVTCAIEHVGPSPSCPPNFPPRRVPHCFSIFPVPLHPSTIGVHSRQISRPRNGHPSPLDSPLRRTPRLRATPEIAHTVERRKRRTVGRAESAREKEGVIGARLPMILARIVIDTRVLFRGLRLVRAARPEKKGTGVPRPSSGIERRLNPLDKRNASVRSPNRRSQGETLVEGFGMGDRSPASGCP